MSSVKDPGEQFDPGREEGEKAVASTAARKNEC
jgi:hypothetical protein